VIAQVAAASGAHVILHDREEAFVERGLQSIGKNLDRAVEKGRMTQEHRGHILARIAPSTRIADWDVAIAIAAATEHGIPIVTTQQVPQTLLDAGFRPAAADAVTADYADAQLNSLKTAMLAFAFLALLSFWFTRRLPGRPEEASVST